MSALVSFEASGLPALRIEPAESGSHYARYYVDGARVPPEVYRDVLGTVRVALLARTTLSTERLAGDAPDAPAALPPPSPLTSAEWDILRGLVAREVNRPRSDGLTFPVADTERVLLALAEKCEAQHRATRGASS